MQMKTNPRYKDQPPKLEVGLSMPADSSTPVFWMRISSGSNISDQSGSGSMDLMNKKFNILQLQINSYVFLQKLKLISKICLSKLL